MGMYGGIGQDGISGTLSTEIICIVGRVTLYEVTVTFCIGGGVLFGLFGTLALFLELTSTVTKVIILNTIVLNAFSIIDYPLFPLAVR